MLYSAMSKGQIDNTIDFMEENIGYTIKGIDDSLRQNQEEMKSLSSNLNGKTFIGYSPTGGSSTATNTTSSTGGTTSGVTFGWNPQ